MPAKSLLASKPASQSRWVSYGYLLINTICWGAALVVVKPALDHTTPFRFLFYRFVIAGILSLGFIWHYWPQISQKIKTLKTIFLLELIGLTLTLALLYSGLKQTSATEANLIGTTTPLFIVLIGIWWLKEKQTKHEWLGTGLAFLGTVLLSILPLWENKMTNQTFSLTGNLLVVGQNITTAIYFILAKKYYHRLPTLFVASISFWIGIGSFWLLSLQELNWQSPAWIQAIMVDWTHPSIWVASFYMAIFGSIIGLTAYIQGQAGIEASEASVFWYLQPLVYLPLGTILLGEKISVWQILALSLILSGVILAEYHKRRQKHLQKPLAVKKKPRSKSQKSRLS